MRIREISSTVATSTQIPNHKTTKKKSDISKQHSKQAKTWEVERNYKMFANPVVINPGRIITVLIQKGERSNHSLNAVRFLLFSYLTPAFQLFQFVALNSHVV